MSAPRVTAAFDPSALEARIDQLARLSQERAERIERFLMTRVDDIETQMIVAPSAPAPMRTSEMVDLDLKLHELAARFEDMKKASATPARPQYALPEEFEQLADRVSDLEVSIMELRIDQPASKPSVDLDMQHRILEIEARHSEIVGTLRNLLTLLTARQPQRATG